MKLSKGKRKASAFLILQTFAAMDSMRILLWSHVARDLKEGLTGEELERLKKVHYTHRKVLEHYRVLGRQLEGHES